MMQSEKKSAVEQVVKIMIFNLTAFNAVIHADAFYKNIINKIIRNESYV